MKAWTIFCDQKIQSLAELEEIYYRLLLIMQKKAILLLIGPAGAGKTTSVQILAKLMNISDVVSPSFGIHHRYENADGRAIDHVDLYRLRDADDLESTGFWDLFSSTEGLVAIEWADRLEAELLPLHWQQFRISIEILAEIFVETSPQTNGRQLKIEFR